ncbi:MAG: putative baseplate assembly protein [Leptothrix sp. (in: b-proteobacteria)]
MDPSDLTFSGLALSEQRRRDVRRLGLNGISDIEFDADSRLLRLRLFMPLVADLTIHNLRVDGGVRVRAIRVVELRQEVGTDEQPTVLIAKLDRLGDFSTYTACLVADARDPASAPMAGFDTLLSQANFRFREASPDADCDVATQPGTSVLAAPEISYLARDYASFRQLLMDRLSLLVPQWSEPHVPDLGVALVEVLAYTGDRLSYYQDAVATEAYLSTARQRISVRRHARLVDYHMHEGCNARTWVQVQTDTDLVVPHGHAMQFLTDWTGSFDGSNSRVDERDLVDVPPSGYQTFVPVSNAPVRLWSALGSISLHAWGNPSFTLPLGATHATLVDGPKGQVGSRSLQHLTVGDFLLFKAVRSLATGQVADADAGRRHVVRLTRVEADIDPLYNLLIVHVHWEATDALPFPLPVSGIGAAPACEAWGPATGEGRDLAMACGNILLVDEGRYTARENLGEPVPLAYTGQSCSAAGIASDAMVCPARFRPALRQSPLVWRAAVNRRAAAVTCLHQDPRAAVPQLHVQAIPGLDDGSGPLFRVEDLDDPGSLARRLSAHLLGHDRATPAEAAELEALIARLRPGTLYQLRHLTPGNPAAAVHGLGAHLTELLQTWQVRPDLLESRSDDFHCTVEVDNDGVAQVRFGDGDCGRLPDAGARFLVRYRTGSGPAGNVGADTINRLISPAGVATAMVVGNPLAAKGGQAAESLADVKQFAPSAFRQRMERAITAEDYSHFATEHPGVQRAAATLRWNGSRTIVHVALDPLGGGQPAPALLGDVGRVLERYRRIGHDVEVVGATYVPLDIAMTVTVQPHYHAKAVKQALLAVFGDAVLPDGTLGVFHPDNLSFGQSIELSRLVARAQAVTGVECVDITRLQRLRLGPNNEIERGFLSIGPLEIGQLDNDPNFPESGRLRIRTEGGR